MSDLSSPHVSWDEFVTVARERDNLRLGVGENARVIRNMEQESMDMTDRYEALEAEVGRLRGLTAAAVGLLRKAEDLLGEQRCFSAWAAVSQDLVLSARRMLEGAQ